MVLLAKPLESQNLRLHTLLENRKSTKLSHFQKGFLFFLICKCPFDKLKSLYLSFEQQNSENYLSIFISSNVQLWKLVFEKFSPFAVVMESRLGGEHLFALLFAFQQTRFSTSYFALWVFEELAFRSRHFGHFDNCHNFARLSSFFEILTQLCFFVFGS